MLDLKNVPVGIDLESLPLPGKPIRFKMALGLLRHYGRDIAILLVMTVLLYSGASWQFTGQFTDLGRYQCYAVAFWQGSSALHSLPRMQCSFLVNSLSSRPLVQQMQAAGWPHGLVSLVASQPTSAAFHALPPEYPLLTMLPFSLGLIGTLAWYRVTFAFWMAVIAAVIYLLLKRYRSTGAAIAFVFYLVVGSWSTALGRFDIVPSALTLIALLCAERAKWRGAFALLALATMFKFYPVILIVPFFIAQQKQLWGPWYAWHRWREVGIFASVCVAITAVSLALNVGGTLAPLSYFSTRPIQVESFSASLLWLGSFLGFSLHPVSSYGSLNVISPLSSVVSVLGTLSMLGGLGYTCWLQVRGRINLFSASLLTLLVVIITGKVFSPQYLIWVLPLVAYIGKNNWRWLASWGLIGLLTTWVFPYLYTSVRHITDVPSLPVFYPVAFLRNVLLLAVTLVLFYQASHPRQSPRELDQEEISETIADGAEEDVLIGPRVTAPLGSS